MLRFVDGHPRLAYELTGEGPPVVLLHGIVEPIVSEVYGAALVLIRPDLMVAWRSDEVPDDPAVLIDTVRGVSTPH